VGSDEAAGDQQALLGWYATWSMALASLLGGGVFSVLWVVVRRAGALAWASFVLAGVVGLITAWSYARLAADVGDEGGGTFVLIRDELGRGTAAVMSGLLLVTYLMALAVYSTTFGSYLAPLFGLGSVAAHVIGVLAVLVVATLALWGIGNTASIEVGTVWPKALVLLALAGAGLGQWAPAQLATGIAPAGMGGVLLGAAGGFLAVANFPLVVVSEPAIRDPARTMRTALPAAVVAAVAISVLVALGAGFLISSGEIVAEQTASLLTAGEAALGSTGGVIIGLVAAGTTGMAMYATLRVVAEMAQEAASDEDLPRALARRNLRGVPTRSMLTGAAVWLVLSAVGSGISLVEGASLAFLLAFAGVNAIAALRFAGWRWVAGLTSVMCAAGAGALVVAWAGERPVVLAVLLVGLVAAAGWPLGRRVAAAA
jgi:amino acid transporter